MTEVDSKKARDAAFYAKSDLLALLSLIRKLEKPLTSPNWDNECKLLIRASAQSRKSLLQLEQALVPPKPA